MRDQPADASSGDGVAGTPRVGRVDPRHVAGCAAALPAAATEGPTRHPSTLGAAAALVRRSLRFCRAPGVAPGVSPRPAPVPARRRTRRVHLGSAEPAAATPTAAGPRVERDGLPHGRSKPTSRRRARRFGVDGSRMIGWLPALRDPSRPPSRARSTTRLMSVAASRDARLAVGPGCIVGPRRPETRMPQTSPGGP